MGRPITLFTGQWADLPLESLAEKASGWGYDGLELICLGDHLDPERAARDKSYARGQLALLERHHLKLLAINNAIAGQLVCDPNNDSRSDKFAPASCAGDPEKKRAWAVESMKNSARAARNLGLKTVIGFTGSSIWHLLYSFPPVPDEMIEEGFRHFAAMWNPILDVFDECGVRFALEVHPTEIAFDVPTARRALQALGGRPAFGFNFDPSHLHLATRRSRPFPARILRPDLPRPYEGCRAAAERAEQHPGLASQFRPSRPQLGFPIPRPRRRQVRGDHPDLEPRRLWRAALRRVGGQRHGTGAGRPGVPGVRPEIGYRAVRRGV